MRIKHLFPDEENAAVVKLVSLSYALLPMTPHWWVAAGSVPLFAYVFLLIGGLKPGAFEKRVLFLLFLPIFSLLPIAGFFILILWVLGIMVFWMTKKKLNINLVIGFCCLLVGYVLVELRLFYAYLFLREPLNRSIWRSGQSLNASVGEAFARVNLRDIFTGHYHAPILGTKVLMPVIVLTLASAIIFILWRVIKNKSNAEYGYLARYSLLAMALLASAFLFRLVEALYQTSFVTRILRDWAPLLLGFGWNRFFILNRTLLYLLFALSLITLLRIFQNRKIRFLVYAVACLQILLVIGNTDHYNYSGLNLRHDEMSGHDSMLTYNEFYAEDFFNAIKEDLDYDGEGVAALGYHPGVLMYNDFTCLDAAHNIYPLSRMLAFREVIAPQLEVNPEQRDYYDRQGIRMYLYNDDIDYAPTKTKATEAVELRMDTAAFRGLGGTYILSRAEIANAGELNLSFVNHYDSENSVYEILVYRAD